MTEILEYDVIVIGAGLAGGLPAGNYLQKAGARVLMIDANQEVGTHCKSNEFFPNAMCTPCASGYFGGASPMWEDLGLEDYGLKYILPKRFFGAFFPDHTNLFLGPVDIEGSIEDIAKFSQKDADKFVEIVGPFMEAYVEMNELMFFSPPDPRNLTRIYETMAEIVGLPVDMFADMNGFELLDVLFEDHHIKQVLLQPGVTGIFGDPGQKGQGAFNVLAALFVPSGQLLATNHSKVHALVRCYLDNGGTLWRNSPVVDIVTENGTAKGVRLSDKAVMHPGETIMAKHAVISNVGAKLTLDLIGAETMQLADPLFYNKMKYFDNASRASSVTIWALKGFPNWKSAASGPYIHKSDFFYKGKNSFEEWRSWYMAEKSGDPERAFSGWWEMLVPAALDPVQASPEGVVTFRLEEIMPFWWREEDGYPKMERWDDEKWNLVKKREDELELYAPGFKDQIVDVLAISPLDLWRGNMASECGDGVGGAYTGSQWMYDRMPYRMPIQNLYMCNSVWPVSLSWGAPGYNAACCVAEDMGIRNQPWWNARPGEWMFANIDRLVADE
jgi:phytoene dehydrogenase-like protein